MNYEDVQKLSNAAKNKIGLLNGNFLKYFLRAVMAGFFIDVAVIYSNVIGSVFSGSDPAWGKFLGAVVFSIAVLLISLVGGELFTGNNMVMAFGARTLISGLSLIFSKPFTAWHRTEILSLMRCLRRMSI